MSKKSEQGGVETCNKWPEIVSCVELGVLSSLSVHDLRSSGLISMLMLSVSSSSFQIFVLSTPFHSFLWYYHTSPPILTYILKAIVFRHMSCYLSQMGGSRQFSTNPDYPSHLTTTLVWGTFRQVSELREKNVLRQREKSSRINWLLRHCNEILTSLFWDFCLVTSWC